MDEELMRLLYRMVGDRPELVDSLFALVVAERDGAYRYAAQICRDNAADCRSAGDEEHIQSHITDACCIEALTPSTAQSREREIRLDELRNVPHYSECPTLQFTRDPYPKCTCWVGHRISELSASSQPKGCTCDRTGWPGSASPELHEVNCPAKKDGRKS